MKSSARKALLREYKDTPRPAGIYRVRNTVTGRALVGASVNVPGILNRHRFQLQAGSFPDKELQGDWAAFGAEAFAFETVDQLEARPEPGYDPRDDLRVLKQIWLDKLQAEGTSLYARTFVGD